MSFGTYARKVRDPGLPYGRRVSMLRSCVQLYRPIGFHATLSFLEETAGPFVRREAALVGALDLLTASRERWLAVVREYAAQRTIAKRRGQRSPDPHEVNPYVPGCWYGAPRQGALHALTYWSRTRLPGLLTAYPDRSAREIEACVTACLAAGGELTPDDRDRLRHATDTLEARYGTDLYHEDQRGYFHVRDLLELAHHIRIAADPPH